MTFKELEDLFVKVTATILGNSFNRDNINLTYLPSGQPGFEPNEDVVFIRLFEKLDAYSQQRDIVYYNRRRNVIKSAARTRVWQTFFVVYGPNSHKIINQIKDGVFLQKAKKILAGKDLFLVPDLPTPRRVPELFAGQWWERWDLALTWNELYKTEENVGSIETVVIKPIADTSQ